MKNFVTAKSSRKTWSSFYTHQFSPIKRCPLTAHTYIHDSDDSPYNYNCACINYCTFIVSIRGSKFWLLDGRTTSGGSKTFLLSKRMSPTRKHTSCRLWQHNIACGKCFQKYHLTYIITAIYTTKICLR